MVVPIALAILLALFLLGCIPIILDHLGFILYFIASVAFLIVVALIYFGFILVSSKPF